MHSVVRIWPPTSVQASPVVAPISFLLLGGGIAELRGAEQFGHLVGIDDDLFLRFDDVFRDDLAGDLAGHVADFALQIANAGFARVVLDQVREALVGELDLLGVEPGRFHLLLHEETLGDFELFEFGVAREADDFHAVLQGRRNGVQHVGRGDEEDLREIVFHVEVVIDEHVILFGVEHFEQRR